jgi:GNAT superfamily N-acetyltransferase
MLCRVRTTLADRPGALAALAQRCGQRGVNILGLQIFPGADTVADELVLRTPEGWGLADVTALVEDAGGAHVCVTTCTAHALTDTPTQYVRAAARLVEEPDQLSTVLAELLDTGRPFTDTERARANALADLATRALVRTGDDDPPGVPRPGPAQAGPPVVRFGQLGDAPAVVRMHERCSSEVLLRRYHVPLPRLTWRAARRLLSPSGGGSLVAVQCAEVVGMAVVAPYGDAVMELGLLVEDGWQRRGLGTTLLQQAARFAVSRGATELLCSMQSDNRALLPAVRRSGLTCRLTYSAGTVDVRVPLRGVAALGLTGVQPVQHADVDSPDILMPAES